jgi:hypothetical protein
MKTTLADFNHAASAHVHLAESYSLAPSKKTKPAPAPKALPGSIAYVSSVALECSIKSLILKGCKVADTVGLQKQHSKLYKGLFSGSSGHNLSLLAKAAGLARHLGSDAPKNSDKSWARMCNSGRPYTLRYGTEVLSLTDARSELRLADDEEDRHGSASTFEQAPSP